MPESNLERLIQLATDVFAAKSDPEQLDVDEKIIERLKSLHPSTVSEYGDSKGPAAWVLVIPTTDDVMNQFIAKKITEKQLLDLTPLKTKYNALYLCSALTLPEYRGKGITKKLTLDAIESIRQTHPVKTLFVWPFTKQGEDLADAIARTLSLPLLKRPH
jgi:ribosomal protein S18 acetylase RimI-like enzyme